MGVNIESARLFWAVDVNRDGRFCLRDDKLVLARELDGHAEGEAVPEAAAKGLLRRIGLRPGACVDFGKFLRYLDLLKGAENSASIGGTTGYHPFEEAFEEAERYARASLGIDVGANVLFAKYKHAHVFDGWNREIDHAIEVGAFELALEHFDSLMKYAGDRSFRKLQPGLARRAASRHRQDRWAIGILLIIRDLLYITNEMSSASPANWQRLAAAAETVKECLEWTGLSVGERAIFEFGVQVVEAFQLLAGAMEEEIVSLMEDYSQRHEEDIQKMIQNNRSIVETFLSGMDFPSEHAHSAAVRARSEEIRIRTLEKASQVAMTRALEALEVDDKEIFLHYAPYAVFFLTMLPASSIRKLGFKDWDRKVQSFLQAPESAAPQVAGQ